MLCAFVTVGYRLVFHSNVSVVMVFTVDHAMNSSFGGFPTITYEHRNFTVTVLSEVCHDVTIEPVLQQSSGCGSFRC